ncbi:MAG TPA: hypothetical protein VIY54_00575 [Steroidobacteraceae bacterium]
MELPAEAVLDAELLLGADYAALNSNGRPTFAAAPGAALGMGSPQAADTAPTAGTAVAPSISPAVGIALTPRVPPAPRTLPAASTAPVAGPAMDRDFIARNQIVERYISGRLPLKGATDFERFCRDNPHILDELGLPERVNAGLRLLDASGKPEPWQVAPPSRWLKPQWFLGLTAAVFALTVALAILANAGAMKSQRILQLQKQAAEKQLDPATSTRTIRLMPSRDGASNVPAVIIGGREAELVDFRIDETRSPYKTFRITLDRIDQGRVAVLHNLLKDSNGHLRVALNSSALGPGNYQLTIEGLSWRGEPEPDSWVTIGVQH